MLPQCMTTYPLILTASAHRDDLSDLSAGGLSNNPLDFTMQHQLQSNW